MALTKQEKKARDDERFMNEILHDSRYMLKEAMQRVDNLLVNISTEAAGLGVGPEYRAQRVAALFTEIAEELAAERGKKDERKDIPYYYKTGRCPSGRIS